MTLRSASLTVKLPLLMSALVFATVVAFASLLFFSFDDTLYDASSRQLQSAGTLLADLLARGMPAMRQRSQRIAQNPAVVAFASSGRGRETAASIIGGSASPGDSTRIRTEIISTRGEVLLAKAWHPAPAVTEWAQAQIASGKAASSRMLIGPIINIGGRPALTTITPVRPSAASASGSAPLAYLSETRSLSGSGQGVIGKLIGKRVTFLIGQTNPAVWTDLQTVVPGPPKGFTLNSPTRFAASSGGDGIGYARAVPGTTWIVWLQQPGASVLAPLMAYLRNLFEYGTLIALLGALIVWVVSQRMTKRLVRLTKSVERIESGSSEAVSPAEQAEEEDDAGPSENEEGTEDEISRLLSSFKRMRTRLEAHTQLEGQLRHAQKVDAVGRLASGVAHDFNNLLTAIRLFGMVTLEEMPADSPLRENLQEICKATDRGSLLTSQLLGFTRKSAMSNTVLDLSEVASGLEQMLTRLLSSNVRLSVKADGSVWPVWADRGHVEQVLVNLAVNSRDAMPNGGDLRITLENVSLPQPIFREKKTQIPRGAYVVMRIADTGEGMSEETKDRIFEPFFTTKASGKGTGLGLSTVFGIIDHWHGYITVDSAPGNGTTFSIYLPRYVPTLSTNRDDAAKDLTQVA